MIHRIALRTASGQSVRMKSPIHDSRILAEFLLLGYPLKKINTTFL